MRYRMRMGGDRRKVGGCPERLAIIIMMLKNMMKVMMPTKPSRMPTYYLIII